MSTSVVPGGLFASAFQFQQTLTTVGFHFCFIGGIVLQRWGEPRFTRDIDLTLLCPFGDESYIAAALEPLLVSRIASPREFAAETRIYLGQLSNGTPVDIALGGLPFEERAVGRATRYAFSDDIALLTCSAEDLVVSWNPVTTTISGGPVKIIAYQLIIQEVLPPHHHRIGKLGLSMYVLPTMTSVTIPDELLVPGKAYNWEVLAIEESGNQTLSSSAFITQALLTLSLSDGGLLSFTSTPGHHYDIEMCPQLGAGAVWNVIHRLQATESVTTHHLSVPMVTGGQAFIRVKDATP